mmetsp:Transcript_21057/g.32145  ORF Transcript_21057/g.32145 Transcript_21057/m.32145 type:complete len:83 (+) Transcript_21057:147-395(+)
MRTERKSFCLLARRLKRARRGDRERATELEEDPTQAVSPSSSHALISCAVFTSFDHVPDLIGFAEAGIVFSSLDVLHMMKQN